MGGGAKAADSHISTTTEDLQEWEENVTLSFNNPGALNIMQVNGIITIEDTEEPNEPNEQQEN